MTLDNDPAFEIRRALDREVERKFDAARLSLGLESSKRYRPRSQGPLARIPVPVQWIGIVAAVIAAVTGLRSIYLELAARPARPASESRAAAPSPLPHVEERADPRQAQGAAAPVATPERRRPVPTLPTGTSRRERVVAAESKPEEPSPPGAVVAEAAPGVIESPARVNDGAVVPPPQVAESRPERVHVVPAPTPEFRVTVAGVSNAAVGGVRLASFSVAGRRLTASVREAPEVGATLVTILGTGEGDPEPAAPPRRDHGPHGSGASSTSSWSYSIRLLTGTEANVFAPGEQKLLGSVLRVEPPRDARDANVWGSDQQKAFLRRTFGLRTVVATSAVRVTPPGGEDTALAVLHATVGNALYDVAVRATPNAVGGEHQVEVSLSRRFRSASSRDRVPAIEGRLLIEEGRIVVLALPDPLRIAEDRAAAPFGATMVFVALSPRFDGPESGRVAEHDLEPPILIDGPAPGYPDQARDLRAAGKVVLRAVVREDASVDGIEVVEAPDGPGSSYLIEAAIRAAEKWRYLPARRRGRIVDAYVTISMEFRADE